MREPHREIITDPSQLAQVGKAMGPMNQGLRLREVRNENTRADPADCTPFTVISLIQSVARPERIPFFPYAYTGVSHNGIELVAVVQSTDAASAARVVTLHFPEARVLVTRPGDHNVEGIEWYGIMPPKPRKGWLKRLFSRTSEL